MTYSFAQINSVADCDALIQSAQMERQQIEFRKYNEEFEYQGIADGSIGVDAQIAGVNSEIVGLEALLPTLEEGTVKTGFKNKLTKLIYKKFLLGEKKIKQGLFALLEKEYDITVIEQQLATNQAYIDALEQRKAEL